MSEKQTVLAGAETEFARFKKAIAGLDEPRMREAWLGVWGVREIVSHISGWHRELSPALERMARGERPIAEGTSYEDVDAWNLQFAGAKKDVPVSEIFRELDLSHEYFMAQARKVSEERFVPGKTAYRIVDLNSAHHYKDHGDQIRAWRKSKGL